MPIVTSTLTENVQANGKRSIHEIHTDQFGAQYPVTYQAEPGEDIEVNKANHAEALSTMLEQSEIDSNITEIIDAQI